MQVAYSFDRETVKKIVKGAIHAMVVAGLLGLLDFLLGLAGTIQSSNTIVVIGLAWFTQTGYQVIRQYIKGI